MAKSKRKGKYVILLLIAVAGLAAALVPHFTKSEPPINIEKEKVTRRNITELVVASGKIQPVVQVKISPEVSGEIIELAVKEGQRVKKGDLLLKIRPDNYIAARNSAEANYKFSVANKNSADANLEKADLEYKRNDALFKAKLISDSDYLTAKTTYEVAKTTAAGAIEQVQMAKASLDTSETDLSKTIIYSPLDGTVSKLNSQLGERVVGTAMMAGTEIMTVADLSAMEARVDIGEIDVVLMAVGEKVRLEVDSFKDRKFDGVVTDIANSANNNDPNSTASSSATTTDATKFQVKIRIAEKEIFLPGMSVTANIETRYRTNVLSIPIQCVTTRMPKESPGKTNSVTATNSAATNPVATIATNTIGANGVKKTDEPVKPIEVVFVVEGDHVKMTPVTRGISDDNYVEIVSGLKEGEEVVTGSYKAINRDLEDGKKVSTTAKVASRDKPAVN